MKRPMRSYIDCFAGLLLLGLPLSAQESAPALEQQIPVRIRGIDIRDLDLMRKGLPIELIGSEEGSNGFRHLTPSLERSDRNRNTIDPAELYRRKLAMYENGEFFTMPLPTARGSADSSHAPEVSKNEASSAKAKTMSYTDLLFIAFLIVAAFLARYTFKRTRA